MNKNVRNRHLRHLTRLALVAEDVVPVGNAKVAASIVYRNKEISLGVNQRKTHPLQAKFARKKDCTGMHAEIAAIISALRRISVDDLRSATLYISRVKKPKANTKHYEWGLVKPCTGCQNAINVFEIGKVIYTCEGVANFEEI